MLERKNYNVGEWSEIYALLRLLEVGKLYSADENLNRIEVNGKDVFFPILRILREEKVTKAKNAKNFVFMPMQKEDNTIRVYLNDELIYADRDGFFKENADILLKAMKEKEKSEKAMLLENVYSFLEKINIERVKQGVDKKADIVVQLHDIFTGLEPTVGFSIKSFVGNKPTLFNATTATHFVYHVKNMDVSEVNRINALSSPTDRYQEIFSEPYKLQFVGMDNMVFRDNLKMIDSSMPKLMSEMLIAHYSGKASNCPDMVEYINSYVLKNKECPKLFLEYKFKEFLCATALSMKPSTIWDGKDEANGGYIVIKQDGSIVTYYLYNRDYLKDYLYLRTKFEKPDSRINYGYLYEQNGKVYIKLTLQIRFR